MDENSIIVLNSIFYSFNNISVKTEETKWGMGKAKIHYISFPVASP